MTVPAGTARIQYLGSGSSGPFAFNFVTYDQTHLKLVKTSLLGIDTNLVLTTDYSVIVAADFSSASITLVVPLAGTGLAGSSEKLTIVLDPPISQLVQWTRNDPFPFSTHQRAADLAVMLINRLNEKIGRSLLLPESSVITGLTLPTPDALKFLRWDAGATALENMDIASLGAISVSAYIQTLLDDVNAGAAQTTLGISAFIKTLLDDADVSTALTTLGVSTFIKTLLDDANASTARTTLGLGTGDSPQFAGLTLTAAGGVLVEHGRVDGTASSSAYDFHTGATVVDYDSRLLASGGTGVAGGGALDILTGANLLSNNSVPILPNIPQNSKSTAYTTVLTDAQKHILHPTADNNARTFTIDSNANVAYPIGTAITFVNQINTVTIAITSDTLTLQGTGATGSRTLAANGIATALKIEATKWVISGTGIT